MSSPFARARRDSRSAEASRDLAPEVGRSPAWAHAPRSRRQCSRTGGRGPVVRDLRRAAGPGAAQRNRALSVASGGRRGSRRQASERAAAANTGAEAPAGPVAVGAGAGFVASASRAAARGRRGRSASTSRFRRVFGLGRGLDFDRGGSRQVGASAGGATATVSSSVRFSSKALFSTTKRPKPFPDETRRQVVDRAEVGWTSFQDGRAARRSGALTLSSWRADRPVHPACLLRIGRLLFSRRVVRGVSDGPPRRLPRPLRPRLFRARFEPARPRREFRSPRPR